MAEKKDWHQVLLEKIGIISGALIERPNERESLAGERIVSIEALLWVLEESRIGPAARIETVAFFKELLTRIPKQPTGYQGYLRNYSRAMVRKFK